MTATAQIQPAGLTSLATLSSLRKLAAKVPREQVIVEIGSYKGRSAIAMALASEAQVIAVDAWNLPGNPDGKHGYAKRETFEAFYRNVAKSGVGLQVQAWQGFSVDVAARYEGSPVGLLFVDGDHSYEAVMQDWAAWGRHLHPCARVAFDDYGTHANPGVKQAVTEIMGSPVAGLEIMPDNLAVVRL